MATHPAQRRYLAEELVRLRRSDEPRRAVAAQRAARIDANPHQIEAVVFALARLRAGGAILADEVGLGKTIEAGLVITQVLAEGARRVLVITPKSLVGQWRDELEALFGLRAREGSPDAGFEGDGVFVVNRESAGSERGRAALLDSAPFDLCVIDEAHEVFAGIYKRFDASGAYDDGASSAKLAGRVREVLQAHQTPVLLLTATPIQNNLAELWGLVQYVDPLGTLLGDLPTFREVFCDAHDRRVARGLERELRGRLERVLQRTLRRQAQPFLERPFVGRQARLFTYSLSDAERSLLDDVTRYLLEPNLAAFQGRHRALLLLGFHRRMASSTRALAASLQNVAERLRGRGVDEPTDLDGVELPGFDDAVGATTVGDPSGELARVEHFIRRAEALAHDDSRFRALLKAVDFVAARAAAGQGSNKLVIFTESLVTQAYLREALVASGAVRDDEITLFRGHNDSPRAAQALERWRSEVQQTAPVTAELAVRLALVHEFKTRARVFISTEAGAKGLNLQFCNTVVNWDLPWNPQRIEQRIGRCHRYGQRHDVTVINFLARDDEAQALTFEILSQKLELFGAVLSASDEVLHRPTSPGNEDFAGALGAELESELARIYERARSLDEVHAELRALRERVDEERRRYEDVRARTVGLIERTLDDEVQRVLKGHHDATAAELSSLDDDLWRVVSGALEARGVSFTRRAGRVELSPSDALPEPWRAGGTVAVEATNDDARLHLTHPLVEWAVAQARAEVSSDAIALALPATSSSGRLRLVKVAFDGFERVETIVPVVVGADGALFPLEVVKEVLRAPRPAVRREGPRVGDGVMDDAQAELLFEVQRAIDGAEHARFELASTQLERFMTDRALVLQRRVAELSAKVAELERRRDGATGSAARTEAEQALSVAAASLEALTAQHAKLHVRDDEHYRRCLARLQARRYGPPRVEVLYDVDVVFR